jgi:SAM-dependent methyltransferase
VTGSSRSNRDDEVIQGFGEEWTAFDQAVLTESERQAIFEQYFSVFPWDRLPESAEGADIGCGSGRWAQCVAPRVGLLHAVDASPAALLVARRNLADTPNARIVEASVDELPFPAASLDFAYSLGVLHHVPDTAAALRSCALALKPGAPFLVYLYYAFDNRPGWYRALWRCTDVVRRVLSRSPFAVRLSVSSVFAAVVYLPLARLALLLERLGRNAEGVPLSYYRHRSFYVMRNDALDRFGTRLEQRFTKQQITRMLSEAGFVDIRFSPDPPYWTAVATRGG